jgi:hypothetical protein
MRGLQLTHDVLDAQLLDRRKERIGRVDALALELRPGRPPRVAAILIGGPVRAERIGRFTVWLSRAMRTLGRVRSAGVSRIPFSAVRCIGSAIQVDVDGRELDAGHLERWLADHVVCRIPGSGGRAK